VIWVGKRIFPRTVQPLVAPIGPETHSVHSSFQLGPKDVPFLTGQKGDGKRHTNRHALRHRLRPRRGHGSSVRVCSCFPEGLWAEAKDGGRRPAGERCSASQQGSVNRWGNRRLPASQDPSCSPPKAFGGETQGPKFRQPSGKGSLPRRERQRGSCLQGAGGHPLERDREGLPTRRVCLCAEGGVCAGVVARHGSLHARGQRPCSLFVLMPSSRLS